MKRKLLVPTDFSENGIKLVKKIAASDLENFELLFTHLFYVPDGIQDLLFSLYRVKEYEVITKRFTDVYRDVMIKKLKREELHRFPVKFFYGNTLVLFKYFLSANKIDAVIWSDLYSGGIINSASIDARSIIKKCGVQIISADNLPVKQSTIIEDAPESQYSV
jgi:hypothetical protein